MMPVAQHQMQPGMMQPGMMQPGMAQPGMMQPGMSIILWNGPPPPNENKDNWFEMYMGAEGKSKIGADGRFTSGQEPDDCGNCMYSWNCPGFAAGEYIEWASDGQKTAGQGCVEFSCCPCCVVVDTRKMMEQKIWTFHQQRGGAHVCPLLLAPAFPPIWS